jgi:hypothetical protein
METANRPPEINSRGIVRDELVVAEDRPRLSKSSSRMAEGQLSMTNNQFGIMGARKKSNIAPRAIAICSLILVSIDVLGAAINGRDFSIDARARGPMILTSDSSIHRGDSAEKLKTQDLDIRAARIFRKTTDMDASISNEISHIDSACDRTLENRLSRAAMKLVLGPFSHEDSAVADCAPRMYGQAGLENCAMNCAERDPSGELSPADAEIVFGSNRNNLFITDSFLEFLIPDATTIRPDASLDSAVVDRQRLRRQPASSELMK